MWRMTRRQTVAVVAVMASIALAATLVLGAWLAGRALSTWLTREYLEASLADALGVPVRVERVALELWRARLLLEDVAVGAGPSWEDGTALQVPRIVVGVHVASLWRRELVLGVWLERPAVTVTARKGADAGGLPVIPDRFAVGPVTIRLGLLAVEAAAVTYTDDARGLVLDAAGVDVHATPAEGGLDGRLRAARLTLTHADVAYAVEDVDVGAALRPDRVGLDHARARFAGERIELSGELTDLAGVARLALRVRGRLSLGALSRSGLLPLAADGVATAEGDIGGTAARPTAMLRVSAPSLRLDVEGRAIEARKVAGRVDWDGAVLSVTDVSAEALGGRVAGAVVLPAADPARARADVVVENVAARALQALMGRDFNVGGVVSGRVELHGDLRRPLEGRGSLHVSVERVTLPAALSGLGAGTVRTDALLRDGGLDVTRLEAQWPAARAEARGRVSLAGPEPLDVTLTVDVARLAAIAGWPHAAGSAVVTAEARGPWTAPRLTGRVDAPALMAHGVALARVRIPFAYAERTLRVTGGDAVLGASRLEVTGAASLPDGIDLAAEALRRAARVEVDLRTTGARVEDLAAWLPAGWPAAGRFGAAARVEGTLEAWRARGEATAGRLDVRGEALEDVAVTFVAGPREVELTKVAARARGVAVSGGGQWRWEGTGAFHAEAAPVSLRALLADWPALEPAGRVRGRADATVARDGVTATVTLTAEDVALAGMSLGAGRGQGALRGGQVTAEVEFPAARLTATARGRTDGSPLAVRVEARDIDARPLLARWAHDAGRLAVQASVIAELSVPLHDPAAARGTVRVEPLVVEVAGETWRAQGPVVLERAARATEIRRAQLASRAGTLSLSGAVGDGGTLDLQVQGQTPLAVLPMLRPDVREAAGMLEATLRIGGRFDAPELGGRGTITGGRLALVALDESLRDVQARFTVSPGGLRIEQATAGFGGGTLAITGDVALEGVRMRGYHATITARRVAVRPMDGLETVWDADLELIGAAERGQVRGEGRLVRGRYDRDLDFVRLLLDRRPAGAPVAGGLHLDVRLALEDHLTVATDVARLRAGGTLQVQGTTSAPIVFGTLAAREGQLTFRRHRFELVQAAARFVDPRRLDPVLDLVATSRIRTYDVRLQVSGRSENLEMRLASTPALPEEDLLALVAFGMTREQLASSGGGVLVGEAAGLLVRELFGARAGRALDVLEVDREPERGGTTVRVGKQIAPRTRVVYSQSIENADERKLRLEYQVIGPMAVAGEQDFRGGFGADVLVRVRFR